MPDTIAAIASPPGRAARAVVRLSGPDTGAILAALLDDPPRTRGAAGARLRLTNRLRLPVLVVRFVAPRSYTAEDAAELLIPGNPALARRVLDRVLGAGARAAEPGEFSARAYLSGRITIEQGEGVARLIAAETDAQLAAARALLSGAVGARYRAWADELAGLLALAEAAIDFTDQEDVTPIEPDDLCARLTTLRDSIAAFMGPAPARESRDDAPLIALVGPPNAGKSTLFNALLGRARAIASDTPGTTRDVLAEPLDLSSESPGAGPVTLADLPGLDARARALDALAQRAARGAIARADALIHCDPDARFDPVDAPPDTPTIRVRTKADLPGAPAPGEAIEVCALDGRLAPLRRAIADLAFASGAPDLAPRHRAALTRAARALDEAIGLAPGLTLDPAPPAGAMRDALDALGELVGAVTPDDVIGRVFATFCVGK